MPGAPFMLTAAMIAAATGGTLTSGDGQTAIDGFSIDSRTLVPGDLFFAIVAARDGHEFVREALAKGAVGVVVSSHAAPIEGLDYRQGTADDRGGDAPSETPVVIDVPDTTLALQDLGRFVRRESGVALVAITGSAGKTTTKETIAAFLSSSRRVIRNKGNLNNHLGLPLSLLELRRGADVAVMELGMNHAGEITALVGIAEPEVRVWTNVGDAHLGYFASREEIADAKGEIMRAARPGDVLIYNADDPLVAARAASFAGPTIRFGLTADADVRAESIVDRGLAGTEFRLVTPGGSADVHSPLLGRGNLANVLAAAAVASHFDVPLPVIAEQCARLQPAPHRGAVVQLAGGVTLLDDSYNSSPAALARVLEVVAHDARPGRKAAVLGEMLELGAHAEALHAECGRAAAAAGLHRLIVVGGDAARALAAEAVDSGMPADAVSFTTSSGAAADLILAWLSAGDLVLVKGSRGIRTDTVVDRITEAFS